MHKHTLTSTMLLLLLKHYTQVTFTMETGLFDLFVSPNKPPSTISL